MNSPGHGDSEEKPVPSSDGTVPQILCRKKSSVSSARRRLKSYQSESASSNVKNTSESSDSDAGPHQETVSTEHLPSPKAKLGGKCVNRKRNSKRVAERVLACMQKKQKKIVTSDSDSIASGGLSPNDMKPRSNSRRESEDATSSSHKHMKPGSNGKSRRKEWLVQDNHNSMQDEVHHSPSNEMVTDPPATSSNDTFKKEEFVDENICKQESTDDKTWKPIEKGLFEKGIEIFGRNRSVNKNITEFFFEIKTYKIKGIKGMQPVYPNIYISFKVSVKSPKSSQE